MVEALGDGHARRVDTNGHRETKGKPPEGHREDHEGHKTEPKRRRGAQKRAIGPDCAIGHAPAVHSRYNTEQGAESPRQQPRNRHEQRGVSRALDKHCGNRPVETKALAPVAMQHAGSPVQIALDDRSIAPPVLPELRPFLSAHVRIGGLPRVGANRVYGRGADQGK